VNFQTTGTLDVVQRFNDAFKCHDVDAMKVSYVKG